MNKEQTAEKIVRNHFWGSYSKADFVELVTDTILCIDDLDNEEDIRDAIYTHLMYTEDMWAVLMHYTDPHHASWDEAETLFYDDIFALVGKIKEADK